MNGSSVVTSKVSDRLAKKLEMSKNKLKSLPCVKILNNIEMQKTSIIIILITALVMGCSETKTNQTNMKNFGEDLRFLQDHNEIVLLESEDKQSMIAISTELQGRVMTSSANGTEGQSYGWINYDLFQEDEFSEHINLFGGEERFWIGPEGGKYSPFFKPGEEMTFENWFVPKEIDTEPFQLVEATNENALYRQSFSLTNYIGNTLVMNISRKIALLDRDEIADNIGVHLPQNVKVVGYSTQNSIQNNNDVAWDEEFGILNIWLLGMFKHTDQTTVVYPVIPGSVDELGPVVNHDYFNPLDETRLKVKDSVVYYKADGNYRSKIGIPAPRAKKFSGSYSPEMKTLTIIEATLFDESARYPKSTWKLHDDPFKGDVLNSYNDGPIPGEKDEGQFYELESSSPAAFLQPGDSLVYTQKTYHFEGSEQNLNTLSTQILGVPLEDIENAFK